jgi:hypothetical protein
MIIGISRVTKGSTMAIVKLSLNFTVCGTLYEECRFIEVSSVRDAYSRTVNKCSRLYNSIYVSDEQSEISVTAVTFESNADVSAFWAMLHAAAVGTELVNKAHTV